MINLASERIGQINKNVNGSLMEVIEYKNWNDVWVKFLEYGNLVHTSWYFFSNGGVKNPYDKTVYGVGYLGEGEYKTNINKKSTPQYSRWCSMLRRCYYKDFIEKNPSYKDCLVAEEWHNFQIFAKWYDENYYEIENEKIDLDKDILFKGNKIYSSETCVFVPERINNLFIKKKDNKGLPIGVFLDKRTNKYIAACKQGNERSSNWLGSYFTIEEAFQVYKTYKEKLIKQVAEKYKDKIPTKLYNALIQYRVEITD